MTGAPSYLSQNLVQHVATRQTRSTALLLLTIPRTNTEFARRSCSYSAPFIWNSLPGDVLNCNSEHTFNKHLKTFFNSCFYAAWLTPPLAPLYSVASRMALYKFDYYYYYNQTPPWWTLQQFTVLMLMFLNCHSLGRSLLHFAAVFNGYFQFNTTIEDDVMQKRFYVDIVSCMTSVAVTTIWNTWTENKLYSCDFDTTCRHCTENFRKMYRLPSRPNILYQIWLQLATIGYVGEWYYTETVCRGPRFGPFVPK